jgi:hypothetical protein
MDAGYRLCGTPIRHVAPYPQPEEIESVQSRYAVEICTHNCLNWVETTNYGAQRYLHTKHDDGTFSH